MLNKESRVQESKVRNTLMKIRSHKVSYAFMAPFSLVFLTFTVVPVLVAIYYSFTYYNVLQPPKFIGWQNYQKLFFGDDIFLIAIKNTFIFAVITGPLSYILCFIVAWLVNELTPKMRSVMTLLFYAPALAGGISLTVWQYIFSPDQYGYLNSFLMSAGINSGPIQWLVNSSTMKGSLVVIILWMSLSVSFLTFIAGFQSLDRSLFEAGAVDGIKNRYQELWFITLPSMKGQLLFAAVMSITGSFGIGDVVTRLCGFPSSNYEAHTIINHLQDYGNIRFDMGYASAIASLLFLIMVLSNKIIQKMLSKVGK
ncbi:MAG: carbohydrate ABC transporter permease [Saccharofermentanales bacterium]